MLSQNWEKLEDHQKANVFRGLSEAFLVTVLAATINLLDEIDGDDDDDLLNFASIQLRRLYTEMRFFNSYTEFTKMVKSPIPAITTISAFVEFLEFWNWSQEIESGSYKGTSRFQKGITQLTPGARMVHKFLNQKQELVNYKK